MCRGFIIIYSIQEQSVRSHRVYFFQRALIILSKKKKEKEISMFFYLFFFFEGKRMETQYFKILCPIGFKLIIRRNSFFFFFF